MGQPNPKCEVWCKRKKGKNFVNLVVFQSKKKYRPCTFRNVSLWILTLLLLFSLASLLLPTLFPFLSLLWSSYLLTPCGSCKFQVFRLFLFLQFFSNFGIISTHMFRKGLMQKEWKEQIYVITTPNHFCWLKLFLHHLILHFLYIYESYIYIYESYIYIYICMHMYILRLTFCIWVYNFYICIYA